MPAAKLKDLAAVIRSKNAGAFQLTLDMMFKERDLYERVKRTGVLNRELIAELYKTPVDDVIFTEYDAAYSFKATIPRAVPSGDFGDSDLAGCQQHSPLLDVAIPLD
jgi:hypothetical protein